MRLASELGFDLVTVGDCPASWHGMVASISLAARGAPSAQIALLVTSLLLRQTLVAANVFSALDELTEWRTWLAPI